MADAFTVKDMELYYGSFHALKNVNLNIASGEITAFIGPSGCGKSTFLKSLNRMNDLVEGCRITGDIRLMGEDIYDKNMDVSVLRRRVGMVFQKPNPFPMSVYDNIAYGPRTHGVKKKAELDEIVEKSLRDAAIWDELKDRLKKSCARPFRRPAAAALHRARAGGEAGGDSDGRADQRARPDFHIQDRGSGDGHQKEYTIVMVTHNMQQAVRVSDTTVFFLLGEIIESGATGQMFSVPKDKRTEDYITGRFG